MAKIFGFSSDYEIVEWNENNFDIDKIKGLIKENYDADVIVDYYDFGFRKEIRRIPTKRVAWWHSSINKFLANPSYVKYVKNYDLLVTLTDGFADELKKVKRIFFILPPVN